MSADANPAEALPPRPLWLAGLIGTAVACLGMALLITLMAGQEASGTSLIRGFFFGLSFAALFILPPAAMMLMLVVLLLIAEPHRPAAFWVWLLAALVASSPVAVFVWVFARFGDCFEKCPNDSRFLIPPLIVYSIGLFGGALSWWVRYYGRAR